MPTLDAQALNEDSEGVRVLKSALTPRGPAPERAVRSIERTLSRTSECPAPNEPDLVLHDGVPAN